MQRQSLGGSPGSKLHQAHGGAKEQALLLDDAPNRSNKDLLVFSTSTSSSVSADDDHKASKPHRLSSPPPTAPHKSIHVIPVLTLLCFLILFLFSHSPSQSDLAQFNGFTKLPGKKRADATDNEIGDLSRFIDIRKSDVLAIRSLRNLQDTQGTRKLPPRSRSHRKIADF
ncbi:unnamed protein product [Prunus armeniaca]|uniref:Uncharacterized protein n=1 Tax=Prunus armeniaca TaxID=36596 RepID=A0A6J5X9M5_PRUAR|nr:hypothetical protein GBA52_016279 [Prunus armeniaca]CAB4309581.1 unnamed protein product [Prunus armeniaca]